MKCDCGYEFEGNFCKNCGKKREEVLRRQNQLICTCGYPFEGNFCKNCGKRKEDVLRQQNKTLLICTCGYPVEGNFCKNCGKRREDILQKSEDRVICNNCGHEIPQGDYFCLHCGTVRSDYTNKSRNSMPQSYERSVSFPQPSDNSYTQNTFASHTSVYPSPRAENIPEVVQWDNPIVPPRRTESVPKAENRGAGISPPSETENVPKAVSLAKPDIPKTENRGVVISPPSNTESVSKTENQGVVISPPPNTGIVPTTVSLAKPDVTQAVNLQKNVVPKEEVNIPSYLQKENALQDIKKKDEPGYGYFIFGIILGLIAFLAFHSVTAMILLIVGGFLITPLIIKPLDKIKRVVAFAGGVLMLLGTVICCEIWSYPHIGDVVKFNIADVKVTKVEIREAPALPHFFGVCCTVEFKCNTSEGGFYNLDNFYLENEDEKDELPLWDNGNFLHFTEYGEKTSANVTYMFSSEANHDTSKMYMVIKHSDNTTTKIRLY